MRQRLYFMLPDIPQARATLDELLLARIEERHIHFIAKDNLLLPDMPGANLFQRTDLLHGLELGALIGAVSGVLAGSLLLIFPPENPELKMMALLGSGFGGALLGSWLSGRAAKSIPSSRLETYLSEIDAGKVLLIVDVPLHKVLPVKQMLCEKHPDLRFAGLSVSYALN